MKREVQLAKTGLTYTLVRSKIARKVRLSVNDDGQIRLSLPSWVSHKIGQRFLIKNCSWLENQLSLIKERQKSRIQVGNFSDLKAQAFDLVWQRLNFFNSFYKFKVNNVAVRHQKTRWGSCSHRGHLSFNYKILFLKPRECDYIVVHELCHLQELNHSDRFWCLVSLAIPDFKEIRKEIRLISRAIL